MNFAKSTGESVIMQSLLFSNLILEEENKVQILKDAIREGIESGIAKDFNPKSHLDSLKAKMKNNG